MELAQNAEETQTCEVRADTPCNYELRWTDEVGTIPVCVIHGNNSRHEPSDDPHRPCLTVDPYPNDDRFSDSDGS